MTQSPNVLILMAEHVSAFADPAVRASGLEAPALQQLAASATRFDRAYCNAPVCGPSRLSFLTGRYPHRCFGYDNASVLPPHVPTFAHMLTLAGYQTAMCGRMHIHGMDQHRGFERRLASELINPMLGVQAVCRDELKPIEPLPDEGATVHQRPRFSDSPLYQHDEYVTEQACRYLAEAPGCEDRRPFCLVVGYHAAHPGSNVNPAYEPLYEKYLRQDLPLYLFTEQEYDGLSEHAKRFLQSHRAGREIFSRADQHRHMALYLAAVEYFDRQVGRVLQALTASGLDDNTIVIVTSDHGDNMGRLGMWGKMNFYEGSQRIPLYVRRPGTPAQTVTQPVSLVDILPTLADFAGMDVPFAHDGESLVPLIDSPQRTRQEKTGWVFSEYHGRRSASDMYMIVNERHKYCHYLIEEDELFDLEEDPMELTNRIDDARYTAIAATLKEELSRRVDPKAVHEQIEAARAQRETVYQAMVKSPVVSGWMRKHIQQFRCSRDEPWWDGGEYIAAYEPVELNPLAAT